MSIYGYARISTLDQDLSIWVALKAAGCEVIRAEKASGTFCDGRSESWALLDFLRAGDPLVVTSGFRFSGRAGLGDMLLKFVDQLIQFGIGQGAWVA